MLTPTNWQNVEEAEEKEESPILTHPDRKL